MRMMRQNKNLAGFGALALSFLIALFMAFLVMSISVLAEEGGGVTDSVTGGVIDQAGLLTEEERKACEETIASMQEKTQMLILVVTTDDTEGKSAKKYAEDFHDDYVRGREETGGALFLIDLDNRQIYIDTTGKMIRYLTDQQINAVLDDAYDYVKTGDYAGSVNAFLRGVSRYYEAGIPAGQYNYDEETGRVSRYRSVRWYEAILAVAAAAAAAAAACAGVVSQYAMKKERRQSGNYLMAYRADCKFCFTRQQDDFLHKTVTHIVMPRNNAGGGPRGGGSNSSSTHTSSGGRTHGGGGRGF